MQNIRLITAKALCKMQRDQSWSNLTLDNLIKEHSLDARNSAFVSALFYGVLEWRITLDACIAAHCNVKLKKLSLPVLTILRMGIYQLLYMDKVPDSAAVNESVKLAKAMKLDKTAGLINAVLRSFLRSEKQIPLPEDPIERMCVEYSCPVPLVRLWYNEYGEEEAARLLKLSVKIPPFYIRVNTLKINDDELIERLAEHGVNAERTDVDNCLCLLGGAVTHVTPFREGLFHVQDKASQLCALSLDAQPGMRVLDACCAPGGKSFTIAQLMGGDGEIFAADLHQHRLMLVEKRAAEMGIGCIQTLAADMSQQPMAWLGKFDRVLCDVPCSGLGVIARKPELKYKDLAEFSDLPELQYKILANTSQYCKAEGLAVYSTCTLRRAENDEVVERFLARHPDFSLESKRTLLGEEDTDGFFIAVLRRRG